MSLDSNVNEDFDGVTMKDVLPSRIASPEQEYSDTEAMDKMSAVAKTLSIFDKKLLMLKGVKI